MEVGITQAVIDKIVTELEQVMKTELEAQVALAMILKKYRIHNFDGNVAFEPGAYVVKKNFSQTDLGQITLFIERKQDTYNV